jgi:transposase
MSPDDLLPAEAEVRRFDALMDLEEFRQVFRSWEVHVAPTAPGRPQYNPGTLAKLILFGAIKNIRSSRALEEACQEGRSFQWLGSGITPDHSSFAAFLKDKKSDLIKILASTIVIARQADLVDLKVVGIDGTRIESAASRRSVRTQAWLEQDLAAANKFAQEACDGWEKTDSASTPERKQKMRLAKNKKRRKDKSLAGDVAAAKRDAEKIIAALKNLERRKAESMNPGDLKQKASPTDPEGRSFKAKNGRPIVGYNVQLAADLKSGVIVATEVSDAADDTGKLMPMINAVENTAGAAPESTVADGVYNTGFDLEAAKEKGVTVYVPPKYPTITKSDEVTALLAKALNGVPLTKEEVKVIPMEQGRIRKDLFTYSSESDTYTCPRGVVLHYKRTAVDPVRAGIAQRRSYHPKEGSCADCQLASICTKNSKKDRSVSRDQHQEIREEARDRFESAEGRAIYANRSHLAETPMAHMQQHHGIRRFLRYGVSGALLETNLFAIARNLKIIASRGVEFVNKIMAPRQGLVDSG